MNNLGHMLFTARKNAGYSLSQVARGTNIRFAMLQHLEDGDYELMPPVGYVRGFINSYARYLELDPQPFLEQYEKEIGLDSKSMVSDLVQNEEAVKSKFKEHAINLRSAVIIALAVGIIFIIGFAIYSSINNDSIPDENPLPPSLEATTTLDSTTSQSAFRAFTLKVSIVENAATKVIVRIDGANVYDGVLTGDNRLEYDVTEIAEVTAASPDKVRVYKDDERVRFPEDAKENARIEIKAEGAKE